MNKINMEHGQIKRRKMRFWAFLLAVLVLTSSMSPALVMAAVSTHIGYSLTDHNDPTVDTDNVLIDIDGAEISDTAITFDNTNRTDGSDIEVFYYDVNSEYAEPEYANTLGRYHDNTYYVDFKADKNYIYGSFPDNYVFLNGKKIGSGDTIPANPAGGQYTLNLRDYETLSGRKKSEVGFKKWKGFLVFSSGNVRKVFLFPELADRKDINYYDSDGTPLDPSENPDNPAKWFDGYKVELKPAIREGYTFEGWTWIGHQHPEGRKVTELSADGREYLGEDFIDLYASWSVAEYDVTFDSDGGTAVEAQKVKYNEKADKPADPTKEGYNFIGWYLNDDEYDFNKPVTANITLKAKWEKNEEEGGGGEEGGGKKGGSEDDDFIPFDDTGKILQVVITKRTDNSLTISWNKINDADGYLIYGHKCFSRNVSYIADVKDINNRQFTWDNLKKDSYYKFLVKAYKKKGNGRKIIAKSIRMHATTTSDKYTVAKSVEIESVKGTELSTASGNAITLKAGKTATIKAKEILEEPNKTIEEHHRGKAKKVTWISNNPEVAKVSKSGTVKGMAPGTCKVYGSAQNGRFVVVKVTVE